MLFKVGVNVLNNQKMHTRTLINANHYFVVRSSNSIKNRPTSIYIFTIYLCFKNKDVKSFLFFFDLLYHQHQCVRLFLLENLNIFFSFYLITDSTHVKFIHTSVKYACLWIHIVKWTSTDRTMLINIKVSSVIKYLVM